MQESTNSIIKLLDNKRLQEALVQLNAVCTGINDWELNNRIEELQTSYNYMLQYTRQGMEDPNKVSLYKQMLRTAYELTEWAEFTLSNKRRNIPASYQELQLQLEAYTEDMSTIGIFHKDEDKREAEIEKICRKHDFALVNLFEKIRRSIHWNHSEAEQMQQLTDSLMIASNDKAVIISAVMMNLLHLFDEKKYQYLIKAYHYEDKQLSQRALIGIIFATNLHYKRLDMYPNITAQLSLLCENEDFSNDLFNLQMQLLMIRETPKIDKKMQEEIIPEMMKNPQLRKGSINIEDIEENEDRNPEWEKWIDQSGIEEKIREIGDLQMEGADVYMSTFFTFKAYPFFKETAHWFYPFDLNTPDILPLKKEFGEHPYSPFNIVLKSETFCNSDKYSFCLTLTQMSSQLKEQSISQLQGQMDMNEERKKMMEEMMNRPKEAKNIGRQYLQDLYRFVKIWRMTHVGEEYDFLQENYNLWNYGWTRKILYQEEHLKAMAEFLFLKGHLPEAYDLYKIMVNKYSATAEIHQKMGFILQKQKRNKEAIKHYQHADILHPDNVWTLKHLAQCHKQESAYEKALVYYKMVENVQPENLSIAMQIGECLMELNQPSEALSYFYKVEYLGKNPLQAKRAIAWCSFLVQKYEDALKYYHQILSYESSQMQDWMNCGHVYLMNREPQEALKHYAKAQELANGHSSFMDEFYKEIDLLVQQGANKEEICILLDLLT